MKKIIKSKSSLRQTCTTLSSYTIIEGYFNQDGACQKLQKQTTVKSPDISISQIAEQMTLSEIEKIAPAKSRSSLGTESTSASNLLPQEAYISLNNLPEIDTPGSDDELSCASSSDDDDSMASISSPCGHPGL